MRLNQLLAIEKDAREIGMKALTEAYHEGQRATLLDGFTRQYTPDDEEGERFPEETKILQARMRNAIKDTRASVAKMLDSAAQRDWANCSAKSDLVVDGQTIIEGAPATYLLWLEKQLISLKTFIQKLPLLPPGDEWSWDDNADCYVSRPVETAKSKKIPTVLVKYEATKEHPAQTELVHEDKKVGTWRTVKFSGCLPRAEVRTALEKVCALIEATKLAREKANSVEVPKTPDCGAKVLGYIFG